MPTALYFVDNRLLGQSKFECDFRPHSIAYFCPLSGEIWGRIVILHEGPEQPYWSIEYVAREEQNWRGVQEWVHTPGCFCTSANSSKKLLSKMSWGRAIEHLPPAVLQREFDLTLNFYERLSYDNLQ